MKTVLTLIFLLISLSAFSQQRYLNEPLLHYSYSTLITTSAIGYLHYQGISKKRATVFGVLIGLSTGMIKESLDKRFSKKDMAYNVAGVATGAIVINIKIGKR